MKKLSIGQCCRFAVFLFTAAIVNANAIADIAPLSVDQLEIRADAIVVATIEAMRIESEPSRFENGFGNTDWGIYLRLRIEDMAKGNIHEDVMEARCFRIRSRRSAAEYLSPSGHHPIPKAGSLVRVYMEQDGNRWIVLLPNGIASVNGDLPTGSLGDAWRLRSCVVLDTDSGCRWKSGPC